MHFGNQRTGCIKDPQLPLLSLLSDRLRNAMGTENHNHIIGHLMEFLDKDGTALAESIHHELVMHHFVTDIDRGTKDIQGAIDNINGPINAGAKPTWIGKFDLH